MQPSWWGCLGSPCRWLGCLGSWLDGWRRQRQQPRWQVGDEEASDLEQQAVGKGQPGQQQGQFKGAEQQHRLTAEEEEEQQWRELAGEGPPPGSEPARLQEQAEEEVEEQQLGLGLDPPAGRAAQGRAAGQQQRRQQGQGKRAGPAGRPACRSLLGLPILRPDSAAVRAWEGLMSLLDLTYTGRPPGRPLFLLCAGALRLHAVLVLPPNPPASTLQPSPVHVQPPAPGGHGPRGGPPASSMQATVWVWLPPWTCLHPAPPTWPPPLQPTWCRCRWRLMTCKAPTSPGSMVSTSQAVSTPEWGSPCLLSSLLPACTLVLGLWSRA